MKRLLLAALGYLAYRNWRKNRELSADTKPGRPAGGRFADPEKGESGF